MRSSRIEGLRGSWYKRLTNSWLVSGFVSCANAGTDKNVRSANTNVNLLMRNMR